MKKTRIDTGSLTNPQAAQKRSCIKVL